MIFTSSQTALFFYFGHFVEIASTRMREKPDSTSNAGHVSRFSEYVFKTSPEIPCMNSRILNIPERNSVSCL